MTLSNLLLPRRLTEVVDVGANPIDGDPPYAAMLAAGLCRVTGFEPQEQALRELQQKKVRRRLICRSQSVALGEIDPELRSRGFVPHCFAAVKLWPISPCVVGGNPYQPLNQLLEADTVYVRDFSRPEPMSDEQLKHLALVAHHCYGSFDLALRCVMLLEQRKAAPAGAQQQYSQVAGKSSRSGQSSVARSTPV